MWRQLRRKESIEWQRRLTDCRFCQVKQKLRWAVYVGWDRSIVCFGGMVGRLGLGEERRLVVTTDYVESE